MQTVATTEKQSFNNCSNVNIYEFFFVTITINFISYLEET